MWHANILRKQKESRKVTIEELVDQLFAMFDKDDQDSAGRLTPPPLNGAAAVQEDQEEEEKGDGQLTIQEFKDMLEHAKSGLTDEEIASMIKELDEDESGTIDKEEFRELLERYEDSIELLMAGDSDSDDEDD